MPRPVAVCADVGSTFTKVAAVDLGSGELLATAAHRTTVDTDVLHGLDAATAAVTSQLPHGTDVVTTDVCSSAGGGLRLAVVGYEQLVTAEAGHRAGLSAGARVVHIAAGRLNPAAVTALRQARPDIVLLVGGTDGGDADVLRHNATRLASARLRVPVVVAGNVEVRDEVGELLSARKVPTVLTENVLPRIGELNPQPARTAVREVFLHHVIGGKKLSRGPRFASFLQGATPDVVLSAVELLVEHTSDRDQADLLVVDVGGATTDVYSTLTPDPDGADPAAEEVAGVAWRARTVEGDLGMRWSAPGVVAAAVAERLVEADEAEPLLAEAQLRAYTPGFLPQTDSDQMVEARLAGLAATVALRRHARGDRFGRGRRDLSRVGLVIGSGGVLRHAPPEVARACLGSVLDDRAGGWALPRAARVVVDRDYVLAPAGLLAAKYPDAALALLAHHLLRERPGSLT